MNISRRRFMKAGMMVAATALVPLGFAKRAVAQQAKGSGPKPSSSGKPLSKDHLGQVFNYNKSSFTPYVNTEFRVYSKSSKAAAVTLTKIEDFPNSQEALEAFEGECFSLQFAGPANKRFGQQTYEVEHSSLGKFHLFLVPVGMRRAKGEVSYEAVFNHRH
jgi:TAT (twin-arginine translocation) pathway signal sequence